MSAAMSAMAGKFPFLFGGTFIEGIFLDETNPWIENFPSFSEGLSLRAYSPHRNRTLRFTFPFLFGGTFIEGRCSGHRASTACRISLPFRRDFH